VKPSPVVLTNSGDATSDYLCERLAHAGIHHHRIDTDVLPQVGTLEMGNDDLRLWWRDSVLRPADISTLIFRRPKPLTPQIQGDPHQQQHASGEWAEAIEGFLANIPHEHWVNHPSRNFNASHKVEQLIRARKAGLYSPSWLVSSVPETARVFLKTHGPQVVVKPLASGYIERDRLEDDSQIYTSAISMAQHGLIERLPGCPVLFQELVAKKIDVRLIVVDNQMMAVGLEAKDAGGHQRLDIRRNEMRDVAYSVVNVPTSVADGVLRMMHGYKLRFGAFDFAIDQNDQWVFFELNPNGQWAWLDLEGDADVGQMFVNAARRAQ